MIRHRVLPVLVGACAISSGCGDGDKKTTATASAEPTTARSVTSVAGGPSATAAPTTTIIHQGDPIPIRMGGAAMPMPRPTVVPSGSGGAKAPAPRAAAAAPPAAAAGGAAKAPVDAVQIVHNHPPDQPCQPITDAEVKKAFGDL